MSRIRSILFFLPLLALGIYPLLGWTSRQSEWVLALWGLVLLSALMGGLLSREGYRWFSGLGKKVFAVPLLLAGLLLASFLSPYVWGSVAEWSLLSVYVLGFFTVWFVVERRRLVFHLAGLLVASGVLTSLYGLFQLLNERSFDSWIVAQFGWHNTFGGYLVLLLPLGISGLLYARTREQILIWGAASWLMATALILTYSRGAWAAVVAALGLVLVLRLRSPGQKSALLKLTVLAACALLSVKVLTQSPGWQILPSSVSQRAGSTSELGTSSTQGRFSLWQGAVDIFMTHPFTGAGLRNFGRAYPQYQKDVRYFAYDPHDLYLQFAAEAGLPGLLIVCGFLVAVGLRGAGLLRSAWREGKSPVPAGETYMMVGIGAGIAAGLMHNAIDLDFDTPAAAWTLVMLIALLFVRREPVKAPKGRKIAKGKWPIVWAGVLGLTLLVSGSVIGLSTWVDRRIDVSGDAWAAGDQVRAERVMDDVAWAGRFNTGYFQNLTWLYQAEGNISRALEAAKVAIEIDPSASRVYYNRGYLEASQQNFASAQRDYEKAVALDGYNRPRYYYDLAIIYIEQGEAVSAIDLLHTFISRYTFEVMNSDMPSRDVVQDDVVRSYRLLSNLLQESGDEQRAQEISQAADRIGAI